MFYRYKTSGTCAGYIDIEMEGDVLKDCAFHGGCHGNLQAIPLLAKGKTYEELKDLLEGITCGWKKTSCPDQLIKAMEAALAEQAK